MNSLLLKKRNRIASESLDVAEDDQIFSVFTVVDHEQRFSVFSSSSISHTLGFSFFVCLLVWNTLFWYECIWICTEEMEVRVSLNFRLGTFSFLLCIARFFKLQAFFLFCLSRLYIYIYIPRTIKPCKGWVKNIIFRLLNCQFFFFFLVDKRLVLLYKGSAYCFFIFGWTGAPYEFLNGLSSTCQHFKGLFLLTCQHLVKSFYFYILY